jgi:hypothetical protein
LSIVAAANCPNVASGDAVVTQRVWPVWTRPEAAERLRRLPVIVRSVLDAGAEPLRERELVARDRHVHQDAVVVIDLVERGLVLGLGHADEQRLVRDDDDGHLAERIRDVRASSTAPA